MIVLLLGISFILSLFLPTAPAKGDISPKVPWVVDCENRDPLDGFIDDLGRCVPGVVTRAAWFTRSPSHFWGLGDAYAPGVMEWMCEYNGGCEGFKDGVALMSCGDVGRTAWLKRPGHGWDGPFKVVDCSHRRHLYWNVVEAGLVVEFGNKTAERWGTTVVQGISVRLGGSGSKGDGRGVYYRSWWIANVADFILYIGINWELRFAYRHLDRRVGLAVE